MRLPVLCPSLVFLLSSYLKSFRRYAESGLNIFLTFLYSPREISLSLWSQILCPRPVVTLILTKATYAPPMSWTLDTQSWNLHSVAFLDFECIVFLTPCRKQVELGFIAWKSTLALIDQLDSESIKPFRLVLVFSFKRTMVWESQGMH